MGFAQDACTLDPANARNRETETDDARRKAMYFEAQTIVNAGAPWIFLWLPQDIYGVSRRIENWRPQPDSRINLHRVRLAAR